MSSDRSGLLTAALRLSTEERALLAHEILESTQVGEFESDAIARAWAEEIKARISDLHLGIELHTWDDLESELLEAEKAYAP